MLIYGQKFWNMYSTGQERKNILGKHWVCVWERKIEREKEREREFKQRYSIFRHLFLFPFPLLSYSNYSCLYFVFHSFKSHICFLCLFTFRCGFKWTSNSIFDQLCKLVMFHSLVWLWPPSLRWGFLPCNHIWLDLITSNVFHSHLQLQ